MPFIEYRISLQSTPAPPPPPQKNIDYWNKTRTNIQTHTHTHSTSESLRSLTGWRSQQYHIICKKNRFTTEATKMDSLCAKKSLSIKVMNRLAEKGQSWESNPHGKQIRLTAGFGSHWWMAVRCILGWPGSYHGKGWGVMKRGGGCGVNWIPILTRFFILSVKSRIESFRNYRYCVLCRGLSYVHHGDKDSRLYLFGWSLS